MKRISILLIALLISCSGAIAQTAKVKTVDRTEVKVRKDGQPDKRYKENKTTTSTTVQAFGPLKKDGTPDKRYKSNKTSTTTSTSTQTTTK